ncbi:Protein of unknown function [Cotesia congregata]|uniref:Uncharacterized protein n=1 Tax=Cotesia congregata TaxID=51543 RepID=A0A8J2MFJ0_COTCN|nr:Protein of unknown function [Cotesia congregata]
MNDTRCTVQIYFKNFIVIPFTGICVITSYIKMTEELDCSTHHVNLLHKAVADDDIEEVQNLLDLGEDINAVCHYPLTFTKKKYGVFKTNTNCTPLHLAVSQNNKKIVELLLLNKAVVDIEANSQDSEEESSIIEMYFTRNPLLLAIANRNEDKNGADVNYKSSYGETALGLSLEINDQQLTEIILNAGADCKVH